MNPQQHDPKLLTPIEICLSAAEMMISLKKGATARILFNEAIDLATQEGLPSYEIHTRVAISAILNREGFLDEAQKHALEALRLAEEYKKPFWIQMVNSQMSSINNQLFVVYKFERFYKAKMSGWVELMQAHRNEEARLLFNHILEVAKETEMPLLLIEIVLYMSKATAQIGLFSEANEFANKAASMAENSQNAFYQRRTRDWLNEITTLAPKSDPVPAVQLQTDQNARLNPEEIFEKILEADDLVTVLAQYEAYFSPDLLTVIQSKIDDARSENSLELVEAFEALYSYIGEALAQRLSN